MKKQLVRILLLIAVLAGMGAYAYNQGIRFGVKAGIIGNLKFTYPNGTTPEKLFNELDFKPGDCESAIVNVENLGAGNSIVGVFSDGELNSDGFASSLTITIWDDGNILYGPETLATFFADSDILNQINLLTLPGNGTVELRFEVCFPNTDDNELQGDSVVFDLKFGQIVPPIDLPDDCDPLEGIVTRVIEGTEGNDNIHGTVASELIYGYGGNDKIDGSSGSDCIIAGPGNDKVYSTTGDEIIVGGGGDDDLSGGTGNDTIYGGPGNDKISGGSDDDKLYGGVGDDNISGGSGVDIIHGEGGNDTISGGSGKDSLFGEAGGDTIKGDSQNDFLDGGNGTDSLTGNSGTDNCINGESYTSCEF
jgi:Ca2+-binding RTX toxin-like protein